MTDIPPHSDEDFDPFHPDFQHEQPPIESTDSPEDVVPDEYEADKDLGELPKSIPDPEE